MHIRDLASKWRVRVHRKCTTVVRVPGWLSWFSVQVWIWAQVMISQFMGSSPASGSVLTAQDSSPPLPLPLGCSHACMLSRSKLNQGTEKKNPSKNGPLSCKMLTTGEARRVRERGMVYGDSLYVLLYFAVNLKRMSKIRLIKCMKQQKQQNMVSIEATLSIY